MAIVCQGCGEPLPEKEQTCSHCGHRPVGHRDRTRVARASAVESRSDATPKETRLSLSVAPQNVTTFVYLNGGTLLGRAPLHETPLSPGRHRLVLWAPAIRGRAIYSV